ncbi:MAG: AAA family ATPase [Lachnospiraceae bacterium]|nr:AAA family ATPase [Lachnospiraceae bacterium]
MRVKMIKVSNFKGIDNLEIPFEGKSTILFGINGVGKSTILRAIDLIYANIISLLVSSKKKLAQLELDDISYGKTRAEINVVFQFPDGRLKEYSRSIFRSGGRKHRMSELRELVALFEEYYIEKGNDDGNGNWIEKEDMKNMPVFVNYGVNRSVFDVPLRAKNGQFTKLSAFDKAIESKIDFRTLFMWFRNQEDIENQEKVRKNDAYEDRSLLAVKKAMLAMLDGFDDIHIDRRPLAMKVRKDGRYLKINQLSDGEKCTIALFGDLARRMALANPQLSNPLDGQGVVLIDELDLHMHTSWQRKVMNVLRQTFPNIQFIITTHSPQILGELDDTFNLFYMLRENDKVSLQQYKSFIGWDANVILEEVMRTASVNAEIKQLVEEMYEYISNKEFTQAEKIADKLDEISNGYVDGVAKARVLIARGKRNEKN